MNLFLKARDPIDWIWNSNCFWFTLQSSSIHVAGIKSDCSRIVDFYSGISLTSSVVLFSLKLICKLTGDTVNKSEDHIWKHINGRRFFNKLGLCVADRNWKLFSLLLHGGKVRTLHLLMYYICEQRRKLIMRVWINQFHINNQGEESRFRVEKVRD